MLRNSAVWFRMEVDDAPFRAPNHYGTLHLNVGGVLHSTTRETLARCEDSMLSSMFSGRFPLNKDEHGRIFIDRDGQRFRHGE